MNVLTVGSNGVAAKAVGRAMVNATLVKVRCSTHDMQQWTVSDQAFKLSVARQQASNP